MEYQIAAPMALKLHLKVQPKYINCDLARKTYMGGKMKKQYRKCKGTSLALKTKTNIGLCTYC